jgi:hypothetical protein
MCEALRGRVAKGSARMTSELRAACLNSHYKPPNTVYYVQKSIKSFRSALDCRLLVLLALNTRRLACWKSMMLSFAATVLPSVEMGFISTTNASYNIRERKTTIKKELQQK